MDASLVHPKFHRGLQTELRQVLLGYFGVERY